MLAPLEVALGALVLMGLDVDEFVKKRKYVVFRHCERSEAISNLVLSIDCRVAIPPRNDMSLAFYEFVKR